MATNTREKLRLSFLMLLNQQPLGKITVRDITDNCGVNRNSFYYYYADIPSLLQEIVAEDSIRIINEHPTIDSLEECLDSAVKFALDNRRAVMHIFNSSNRDILEQYLLRSCGDIVTTYLKTVFPESKHSPDILAAANRYFKCLLFGFIIDWINDGMADESYRQFKMICSLKKSGPYESLFSLQSNTTLSEDII